MDIFASGLGNHRTAKITILLQCIAYFTVKIKERYVIVKINTQTMQSNANVSKKYYNSWWRFLFCLKTSNILWSTFNNRLNSNIFHENMRMLESRMMFHKTESINILILRFLGASQFGLVFAMLLRRRCFHSCF